jgi:phosphatidyl-myo-inositol dimannoside synthase
MSTVGANKPIKILCVTRAYGEHAGGQERLSFELIQSLRQDPALEVTVVAHRGKRRSAPLFVFTCIPKVLKAAKHADVIHIGDPLLALPGYLVQKILRKPVAIMVHGLDVTYGNIFYQLYLKLFIKSFSLYLPISKHAQDLLKPLHVKGNITVINPGIVDQYYEPGRTRQNLNQLLGQNTEDTIVLTTTGRLAKRKGHAWFVNNVLPQLPENVLYIIAGEGAQENNIMAAAKKNNVEKRVLLLGRVSFDQIKTLYNTVDAFIQPNIPVANDAEGFGLVLLEAASCARPVFAAHLEGMIDAITNGKNGWLLPSQDSQAWTQALQSWVTSGEYRNKSQSVLARSFTLEKFSWQKVGKLYSSALRGLLDIQQS